MSQYNDTGYGTIELTGTVPQFARVAADGTVAAANVQDVGVARVAGVDGDAIGFAYANKQGTTEMIAAGAFSKGAKVYTAAAGKVSSTQAAGAFLRGIAMQDSAGNNSIVEIQQIVGGVAGS